MSHVLMWRAADAGGAVAPHRIVKYGDADGKVEQSAAAGDAHIGVSGRASAVSGGRVEIARAGIADIEYGGNIARGALLTADGDGKAVTAANGNRVIGVAEVSGVAGDIGQVLLAPGLH
ncbi:MAG: DUF2190 family protein [Rhodospirillaceae bacterium]|nr:DUF2190 family protein [Rhodospirillaceae bacterium]